MILLMKNRNNLPKCSIEHISEKQFNSSHIHLVISGFLSEGEESKDEWKGLA